MSFWERPFRKKSKGARERHKQREEESRNTDILLKLALKAEQLLRRFARRHTIIRGLDGAPPTRLIPAPSKEPAGRMRRPITSDEIH